MQTSLALTALVMGLAGGPHCVAMCGAACAGMGQVAGTQQSRALLSFQGGRLLGYSLMGGVAAFSVQALGWLTLESAALRPVWSMLHVAALTGNALDGALTMACFALGSGVSLGFAPWLMLKLKTLGDGTWGIRLAGLALAFTSGWGLWLGLAHNQAPWCAV
ncbi:sulfite exporter TauE/SafE family protein [Limnohabitans sp. MMS-10A-178]|uniref:sulfite exporter TauE/SafE family protein n=1 Tax=Limnohabitans sp. MMS-10A-178 TaxID=1835767 RepID=UPI000D350807|nr:sulfite exporter TauE/SafE family protein [Limnohabitans sp. MMS-10A-178]PUE13998.1 hypothetical protein B9Z32_11930 [Limnohabitans sp. MMS-10A-178]